MKNKMSVGLVMILLLTMSLYSRDFSFAETDSKEPANNINAKEEVCY